MKKKNTVTVDQMKKLVDMLDACTNLNLEKEETDFIKWLSAWESKSVYSFISIIEKAKHVGENNQG